MSGDKLKEAAVDADVTKAEEQDVVPSVLRWNANPHGTQFPVGINAPTANGILARVLAGLGASAANHVVVEFFHELPQEIHAAAYGHRGNDITSKGLYHGDTVYIVHVTESEEKGVVPSGLRRSVRANAANISGSIDAPTADVITASLFVNLGATTANHKVVESFGQLPQQVQDDARAQGGNEMTTKGL